MKKMRPPLIRGKESRTNAGFQENISHERARGKPMKEAIAVAYGEAKESHKPNKAIKKERARHKETTKKTQRSRKK